MPYKPNSHNSALKNGAAFSVEAFTKGFPSMVAGVRSKSLCTQLPPYCYVTYIVAPLQFIVLDKSFLHSHNISTLLSYMHISFQLLIYSSQQT